MNSDGGTLLIGVADDGSILGLDADYQTIGKKNADAYENWLMTRLLESIGRDRTRLLGVGFQTIDGKTICKVDVERSSRPVYVKDPAGVEKFYVRAIQKAFKSAINGAIRQDLAERDGTLIRFVG